MESKAKSTIMTRLEEMKALATEEAVKLKEHATKEEIENLDGEYLDPEDETSCIYGQMTGDCYSDRAVDLIVMCCPRVYEAKKGFGGIAAIGELNGKPYKTDNRAAQYHSAIEMIILEDHGGEEAQQKLIAFLKDETKELSL